MAGKEDKVFDVSKPGNSKPDIGSKPMIIGHKSVEGDPMVKKEPTRQKVEEEKPDTTQEDKEKDTMAQSSKKIKVEPLSKDIKPEETKTSEPSSKKPEEKAVDKPEEKGKDATTEKTDKSVAKKDEKTEDKKKLDPTAKAMEQEDNLKKIIESKKYFVDINETKSGSMKTFILVFLGLVIVGLVAGFVLIDTGMLDSNIELPFSIFGE